VDVPAFVDRNVRHLLSEWSSRGFSLNKDPLASPRHPSGGCRVFPANFRKYHLRPPWFWRKFATVRNQLIETFSSSMESVLSTKQGVEQKLASPILEK